MLVFLLLISERSVCFSLLSYLCNEPRKNTYMAASASVVTAPLSPASDKDGDDEWLRFFLSFAFLSSWSNNVWDDKPKVERRKRARKTLSFGMRSRWRNLNLKVLEVRICQVIESDGGEILRRGERKALTQSGARTLWKGRDTHRHTPFTDYFEVGREKYIRLSHEFMLLIALIVGYFISALSCLLFEFSVFQEEDPVLILARRHKIKTQIKEARWKLKTAGKKRLRVVCLILQHLNRYSISPPFAASPLLQFWSSASSQVLEASKVQTGASR